MGTKKIIDAEQLDGALTASADAIRAKSGRTDKIPWDADTGFADAIAEIPSGGIAVASTQVTPSANSLSITFTGLPEEPALFAVHAAANITLSSTRSVTSVVYDRETTAGRCGYTSGSMYNSTATVAYSRTAYTWTYANGRLTITSAAANSGGYFKAGTTYTLTYATG